jgi:hypothetical protein
MESKIQESFPVHMTIQAGSDVNDFAHTSRIILKWDDICVFKDMCPFNTSSHRCHGTVARNNDFVCNLQQLKSMHKSAVE